MSYTLELPDIGEGVVEAEVMRWFVAEGDEVAEDQPLVEVMTDKATVTIPSPKRGRVVRLCWKEHEIAKVHSALIELELETGHGRQRQGTRRRAGPRGGRGGEIAGARDRAGRRGPGRRASGPEPPRRRPGARHAGGPGHGPGAGARPAAGPRER